MTKLAEILKSKKFHFYLGFAVSLVLIVWLYFAIDWRTAGGEMKRAHLWVAIPSVIALTIHFMLRAWRWRYLLPQTGKEPSLMNLFDSIMIGNFATYILPLRAGEFIRPYLLTRFCSHSFSTSFASVVIERFFDLSMVLITFAVVLLYVDGFPDWVGTGAMILSVMAAGILVFMLLGSFAPGPVRKLSGVFLKFLPSGPASMIEKFLDDLLNAASVLSSGFRLVMTVILTIAVWLSSYGLFYLYFYFFDVPPTIGLSVTTAVVVAFAVAAPSAPGFIAVYQTACIASFAIYGLSAETAVAYSIITHVLQYVYFTLYALFFFFHKNIRFSELTSAGRGMAQSGQ